MAEYVVKAGDTLSGIGAKNGVDWRQITGFRSGNPNLIYPGEVVSWGTQAPQAAPQAPQAPQAPAGPSAQDLANQQYNKWNTEVSGQYDKVGQFDSTAKNPLDLYNEALDKLGIGDARTRVQGLREQLLNTENLLRGVEGSVNQRTAGALMTEGQRQKLVANERAPIAQQATDLGRNFEGAYGDYKDIQSEGKTQADMAYQFQRDQRQALMDRLQVAIGQATSASERQKWQTEFDRLVAKDAEEKRQYEEKFAYQKEQDAKEFALKQQTSGSGSGGSGGGGGSSSSVDPKADFLKYVGGQMKASGGAGNAGTSRQTQDAWVESWLNQNNVSQANRQQYWDLMNSTYNRNPNPSSDWRYAR